MIKLNNSAFRLPSFAAMRTFCAVSTAALALASPAMASGGKGFTYGLYSHDPNLGIDHVGYDGTGDPYIGDTICKQKRPILCVDVDGSARPNYVVTPSQEFYQGWVEGHYTTTLPVRGTLLTSEAKGDSMCAAAFGTGWRMAEFHDSRYTAPMDAVNNWGTASQNPPSPWVSFTYPNGGWTAFGYGNIRNDTRYWVAVNSTTGNCWNP
jgi:hypothetical protein